MMSSLTGPYYLSRKQCKSKNTILKPNTHMQEGRSSITQGTADNLQLGRLKESLKQSAQTFSATAYYLKCHVHVVEKWVKTEEMIFAGFFKKILHKHGELGGWNYSRIEAFFFIGLYATKRRKIGVNMNMFWKAIYWVIWLCASDWNVPIKQPRHFVCLN